jgi:hypothetical protein
MAEEPASSGLLPLAGSLQTLVPPFSAAKLPKVSGQSCEYSRFRETVAGDFVRSRLPPFVMWVIFATEPTSQQGSQEDEGDIDLQGFLGLSKDVRRGFKDIRVVFDIDADCDDSGKQELIEMAQAYSPVFDMLSNGLPESCRLDSGVKKRRDRVNLRRDSPCEFPALCFLRQSSAFGPSQRGTL